MNNLEFMSDKYNVFRKDRSESAITATRGGGVLIAVKNDMHCEEFSCLEMKKLEAVCVRIPLSSASIFIYSLYIQPTTDTSIYRSHIAAINAIKKCITNSDSLHIFGDFNLNGVNWYENDDGFDLYLVTPCPLDQLLLEN